MRADALNLHIYPVRTKMTATKQIPISHVFSTDKIKLEAFLDDKTLSHFCYTDKDKSKGIIVDQRFTEEDKS